MKASRSRRRRAPVAPAVKSLIAVSALFATVSGWIALTRDPSRATDQAGPSDQPPESPPIVFEPLPTLVSPADLDLGADGRGEVAVKPTPALRQVSAPQPASRPSSVTRTRSSK